MAKNRQSSFSHIASLGRARIGHNGGPPLEEGFAWGEAPVATYFAWKRAHDDVWKSISHATMLRRVKLAEAVGLSFEEYTLEILFNGRYLMPEDQARIAEIKAARHKPSHDRP